MTATTLRKAPGGQSITDGPFADTKEQLGGFYLVSATDLDQGLLPASQIPMDAGSIEVRPVASARMRCRATETVTALEADSPKEPSSPVATSVGKHRSRISATMPS